MAAEIKLSSFNNTGGDNFDETTWVVAENSLHHGREYPSHIVLPVLP